MLMCALGTLRVHAQSGFTTVRGLTAYDSAGRRIGNVLGFNLAMGGFFPIVAFSKDSTTVALGVTKNRIGGIWGNLIFTTGDCTRTPYFDSQVVGIDQILFPLTPNFVRDGAVYVPDPSSPPPLVPLRVLSIYTDDHSPACFTVDYETVDVVQAKLLGNLPLFTPPFSVR
ncbi:MAG: hypothetical protein A3H28_06335 [Acidobacteria bacterium RIFCSPLOWO2_02_FULL_61_28]|nr:MAG: hypothetical protein A3H28_06335 [Acidobacteria bacterium RIFCSPLOWO2_02_FULL_61_28]